MKLWMFYPGLIFKLWPCVAGLVLGFGDELFKSQSIVLPQGEADIPQHKQDEFNVLLCEGSDKKLQDVEDEEGVHHLEVEEVSDDGDQVVALFSFPSLLVRLVKLSHDCFQKSSSNLQIDKSEYYMFVIYASYGHINANMCRWWIFSIQS